MLKKLFTIAIFAPCALCFVPAHQAPPKPSEPATPLATYQAAPTLQGATCGTIGPMGADAATVTGVNTAGAESSIDDKPFGVVDILNMKFKSLIEQFTNTVH